MSDLDNNSRYVVHGTAVEGREPTRSTILDQGWTLLGTSTILDQGWTLVSTILDQGWTLWLRNSTHLSCRNKSEPCGCELGAASCGGMYTLPKQNKMSYLDNTHRHIGYGAAREKRC